MIDKKKMKTEAEHIINRFFLIIVISYTDEKTPIHTIALDVGLYKNNATRYFIGYYFMLMLQ